MVNKLFTLLLMSVLAFSLSAPVFAQANAAPETAKKGEKAGKQARWEGMVVRSDKDANTLTVRKRGSTMEKLIHYDSSTEFTSQEHGSKKVNMITANEVKDNDRVICLGHYDDKGNFQANLVSKRLTE